MWLRKDKGGTAIGPYAWPDDGSVCEVPDVLGRDLLGIPDGGFTEVGEPAAEPEPVAPGPEAGSTQKRTPRPGKATGLYHPAASPASIAELSGPAARSSCWPPGRPGM